METGRKIRNARINAGLEQKEVSAKCGKSISYISAYERGCRVPTLSTIVAIASALNVSPMNLLPDSFLEAEKKFRQSEVNTNA